MLVTGAAGNRVQCGGGFCQSGRPCDRGRPPLDIAEEAARNIAGSTGGEASGWAVDVSDEGKVKELINGVIARRGPSMWW